MTDLAVFTFVDQIRQGAKEEKQRTGQYLYNHLPDGVKQAINATPFDPFHKELNPDELMMWVNDHLIFDGDQIVGCFSRNNILWEKRD